MARWPLWRLLVWIEAWLLIVAAVHLTRPIHGEFIVPLLIAVIPGFALVALRGLARAATDATTVDRSASIVELGLAAAALVLAAWWSVHWAFQAAADLGRIDAVLGQSTIIIDVSLTGLSLAACLAALALDFLLATTHEGLRGTLIGVRRTHLAVTLVHVAALFGSAWLLTNWPETPAEGTDGLQRARVALHVYEYARATILPVQAFFAALAVMVVALDSRVDSRLVASLSSPKR